jgi:Leucine-rich repeat (LRR) protein
MAPSSQSTSSRHNSSSPLLSPNITNIREAKRAIAERQPELTPEAAERDMSLENRPEQGSDITAITATSTWSQLPIARPIDVSANESSMSMLPNSGVVPITESQIDRGEISSIRDDMVLRASGRSSNTSSGPKHTVATDTKPRRQRLETTDELESEAQGSEGKQYIKKKDQEPSGGGVSSITIAVIAVIFVVLIAAVAGVCLSGKCGGSTDQSPTPSPTVFVDRRIRISDFIKNMTQTDLRLADPVPQSWTLTNKERAMYWLLDEDPLELQGFANELTRVRQRYVLSSMWFSTVAENLWQNTTNWLSGAHECDWANVVCSDSSSGERQITEVMILQKLDLGGDEIVGAISEDLALLSDGLQYLQLAYNGLTGTIPSALGLLTKLTLFDVEGNSLNGTIPSSFSKWSLMEVFRVGVNDLTGTIPSDLGRWTNADVFSLYQNDITGTVPSSLGKMSLLQFLWIQNTRLSGSLPASLSALLNATEIFVFNTNLNGIMPVCNLADPVLAKVVADCNEVNCSCCAKCCPTKFESIPGYEKC